MLHDIADSSIKSLLENKRLKCTSCKAGTLIPSFLESQFRCHTCDNCGGNWILIEDYFAWKERHPEFEFHADSIESIDSEDTSKALLCPVTGGIMSKFRISKDSPHRLDYSSRVGGVWLDKGEWELLVAEGLAGSLNAILTEQWQHKVKLDSARDTMEALYRNRFGDVDYEKAKQIRDWLDAHEHKDELRRFIMSPQS
ncbi:MAG: zf-TFIIB domain-containing protein [Pseudomonas sp.]